MPANGTWPQVSVIVPCLNEASTIASFLGDLLRYLGDGAEIIVVDDNSDDGTREIVRGMGDSRITVIHRTRTRGLASAIIRGVIESRAGVIIWLDADAWMMPPLLPAMIGLLSYHDIVIASRYVEGGGDRRSWERTAASRLINGWAHICLGPAVRDYTSNFVALRRSVFDAVIPTPVGFGEFFIELIYRAKRKGLSVVEVPYVLQDRLQGVSKASPNWWRFFRLGVNYFLRIIQIRLAGAGNS